MGEITIKRVLPHAALPGGEVVIECAGHALSGKTPPSVRFGEIEAQITIATSTRITARVPDAAPDAGSTELSIRSNGDRSKPFPYGVGRRIATGLHPVANPVIDAEGNIYATLSGRRGQKTPVSIYKISPRGAMTPLVTDLVNATSLAFNADGYLFASSRADGSVYRIDAEGGIEPYVESMGVATGIAFDRDENLYVGDRSGTIFKIAQSNREIFVFATLEPSIAAYHLAFGFDDYLYVSGPTTSSFDSIWRISPSGEVEKYFTGLGRPQGLSFDIEGRLYVAASYRGSRGILRFRNPQSPEMFISGVGIVGMAFDFDGYLIVADTGALYRAHAGVLGKPLP